MTAAATAARPPLRHAVVTIGAIGAIAAAIWLIPASVQIVSWPTAGPVRVGLLAPLARLEWIAAAAVVIATLLVGWGWTTGRLVSMAAMLAPLWLLWLWTVPYLPWVADRIPMLLILAGPVRWIVAAIAVISAVGLHERAREWLQGDSLRVSRRAV
jgi:hypothetical protein